MLEKELKKGDVAGFIVEPIQGKGVNLPQPGYLCSRPSNSVASTVHYLLMTKSRPARDVLLGIGKMAITQRAR